MEPELSSLGVDYKLNEIPSNCKVMSKSDQFSSMIMVSVMCQNMFGLESD